VVYDGGAGEVDSLDTGSGSGSLAGNTGAEGVSGASNLGTDITGGGCAGETLIMTDGSGTGGRLDVGVPVVCGGGAGEVDSSDIGTGSLGGNTGAECTPGGPRSYSDIAGGPIVGAGIASGLLHVVVRASVVYGGGTGELAGMGVGSRAVVENTGASGASGVPRPGSSIRGIGGCARKLVVQIEEVTTVEVV
jgi:hypothetical protein